MSKIHLDADRAAAELCRRPGGLSFFVKEFWDTIVPNDLEWNWHMQVLCDEIEISDRRVFQRLPKLHDLIFNVPPGTSKTKILSILSTAWEFAIMPEIKSFVGSYSDAAVSGIADELRLVMKSDKYRRYFPETIIRSNRDTLHEFRTTKNGQFVAFTVGGTITSKHADILKVDDPLNPKQAASKADLESANTFFDKTLPTRKVDKKVTPTYLIMQRLATNDPTGHLLEKKKGEGIRHICLPGYYSKDVKPAEYGKHYTFVELPPDHVLAKRMNIRKIGLLDSKRLDAEALADLAIDLGASAFAGQVGQTPVPDGGLIWKKWFIEVPDEAFPSLASMTAVGTDWDTAYTKDDDNAGSAYVRSGRIGNKMFIDDLGAVYFEFPELVKFMRLNKAPHYVEAKASGKSTKQTLTKMGIPTIEVKVEGGSDKIARAKMASPYAEAGMCYIRKSLADFLYNDSRQGILNFPKGSHADVADVIAQAINRIFKGSLVVGKPSQGDSVLDYL